jgi:hypothetical protein
MKMKSLAGFVILLLLWAIPATASEQFYFTTNNDGTLTLINYFNSDSSDGIPYAMAIPSTYNGLAVTSVGAHAFDYNVNHNSMYLANVSFPNTITNIGPYAFANCYELQNSVAIPGSVISIGDHAFYGDVHCSPVTISNGVRVIGELAFDQCDMSSVTIPVSVTNIVGGPFAQCAALTAINVDTNNPAYASVNGVLFNKALNLLVQYPAGSVASSAISNNVDTIGDYAFAGAPLTNLTIPSNVVSIGSYAFGFTHLTNVTIPQTVTGIGAAPFAGDSLVAINVDSNNLVCTSVDGVLFNKDQTLLIQYPNNRSGTSYIIPNTVTCIGDSAFYYDSILSSVTLPQHLRNIGADAFYFCYFSSVTIPASVTNLGANAFYGPFLTTVYAAGNAPTFGSPIYFNGGVVVYSLPGTIGWDSPSVVGAIEVLPWPLPYPVILTGPPSFGVQTNQFGFLISWATSASVIVNASTGLENPAWQPIATNALTNGTFYFTDPQWMNYPGRFYRVQEQ